MEIDAIHAGLLQEVAVKEGWEVIERFIDKGISGSKGRDGRHTGQITGNRNVPSSVTATVTDPIRKESR